MFVDFSKYNNEIETVNMNEDEDVIILQTSIYKIKLTAFGECCSCSSFKQYNDFDFNKLNGKIIKKVQEIDTPDDYIIQDNDGDTESPHLFEMTFKNSDEKFKFLMINYSNGYYDGWMNIEIVL